MRKEAIFVLCVLILLPLGEAQITRKVLALVHDPILESQQGNTLRQYQEWDDPDFVMQNFIFTVQRASAGYVNYEITEIIHVDDVPIKADRFHYTDLSYLQCLADDDFCHVPEISDYNILLQVHDICTRTDEYEIDEVWLFGGPHFGFYDSVMTGNEAFYTAGIPINSECNRNIHILGFDMSLGLYGMLKSYGHRVEGVMHHYLDVSDPDNIWDRFDGQRLRYGESLICDDSHAPLIYTDAHCGNVNFAPNSQCHMIYNSTEKVFSDCYLWQYYPVVRGPRRQIDCNEWACDKNQYLEWWLTSLPKREGVTNGVLHNWWEYIAGELTYLPKIEMVEPLYGVSKVSTFDLIIKTNKPSQCKYTANPEEKYMDIQSISNLFATVDGLTHIKNEFNLGSPDNFEIDIYVYCRTQSGYINDDYPQNFTLSVDRSPPNILELAARPPQVIEKLVVNLSVRTDDKTVCKFALPDTLYIEFFTYFQNLNETEFSRVSSIILDTNSELSIMDNTDYNFTVLCMNKARDYSQPGHVSFMVNLSVPNEIIETYPDGYITSTATQIRVITNKDSTCFYGDGYLNQFPQTNKKIHFIERQQLESKEYEMPVLCLFSDLGAVETQVSFVLDTQSPSSVSIILANNTCETTELTAVFSAIDDIGIYGFWYRLTDSFNRIVVNQTFTEFIANLTGLSLSRGERYSFEVVAIDKANNTGPLSYSNQIEVLMQSNDRCEQNEKPSLSYQKERSAIGTKIKLDCVDPDGECVQIQYHLIDNMFCYNCGICPYETYDGFIYINYSTDLCYKITDDYGNMVENSLYLQYDSCENYQDDCCNNKLDLVCDPDCTGSEDVDCSPDRDSDLDLIPDEWETLYGLDPYFADSDIDSDFDGLTNLEEYNYNTNPNLPDTDNDESPDKEEIDNFTDPNDASDYLVVEQINPDTDDDGIEDDIEIACGMDPNVNDVDLDNDDDGIPNRFECLTYHTDIYLADSDDDGATDGDEVQAGTDPLDPESKPSSHTLNIVLFMLGFGLVSGGAALFVMNLEKEQKLPEVKSSPKPIVNFKQAKKEMKKEVMSQAPLVVEEKHQPIKHGSLDRAIRRKRNIIKLKKMSTIFDEFVEDQDLKPPKKEKPELKKEKDVYKRLDAISDEDTEELEILRKKVKR